ncbi:MAG: acryloyl-CoA reductase [Actinomycetales bacterium]|nr:acryloyl-CoA reductase [Actinomycetales bacterium]
MRALVVTRGAEPAAALVEVPDPVVGAGQVLVAVHYSSLNFKDALALGGRPGVVRAERLIAGIDLVGEVAASGTDGVAVGDRVLVNGCGLGETRDGGLAEFALVPGDAVVPVPAAFTLRQAAAIGTAGYTAQLAVTTLDDAPEEGPIAVSGARGGVGSIAIALLARAGREVVAVTRDPSAVDDLRRLGVERAIRLDEARGSGRALDSELWAGAVDNLGGAVLAGLIAATRYDGVVASCGMAADAGLATTVMPFILRGVRLVGINSVLTPRARRIAAWERLARELDPAVLEGLVDEVPLAEAPQVAARLLSGEHRGRTVVDVRR